MSYCKLKKPGWFLLSIIFVLSKAAAEPVNPCGGPTAMLSLVNRPTIANSPCAVPANHAIFEGGFQAQKQVYIGHLQQFPSAVFRVGLPAESEAYAFLPNYIHLSQVPSSGFSPTSIGFKKELYYTEKWLLTLDSLITPPSGSVSYGSQGLGGTVNGIFNYKFSDRLSFTCQLGLSAQTESELSGGKRFTTINPDAFFTWSLSDKLQAFGEIYGQSKTGANDGSGFNVEAGLLYLLGKNIVVDVEAGQRLRGFLGSFEQFFGGGMAVQF